MTIMSTDRQVAHTADLAPATVTDYSRGQIEPRRRRRDDKGQWVDTVARSQIDDRLLASALEAAGGDPNRLWFDGDGAVYVLNHSRRETCPGGGCPACRRPSFSTR